MTQIDLGAFALLEPLGAGGMGEVWRGLHREQQVPVAIKVISGAHAEKAHFIEGFEREVQAVAGLHHPGICRVFDHGHISEAAAQLSRGKLRAGSPWLAMELATRGSLEEGARPTSWKELRALLSSIIDALAHAHARGIVHRDLKPGNILITEASQGLQRYLLTDFGLAHATNPSSERSQHDINTSTAGTPYYMPPEQIQGYWRDYGPWTDLYALGCVAYELACGQPPFVEPNFIRIAARHLNTPPPGLKPTFAVPRDFDLWIQTLLRKNWRERFQLATDAATALFRLSDEMLEPVTTPLEALSSSGTLPENSSIFFAPTLVTMGFIESEVSPASGETMLLGASELDELGTDDREHALKARSLKLAPGQLSLMPKSWRYREFDERKLDLVGAGLGLFGLREVPFVDREEARDLIWSKLRECREESRPHVLHIQGARGTGKSRLVEWMARRAEEVGAAQTIRVTHSKQMAPEDGLEAALLRYSRCYGLERGQIYERMLEELEHTYRPFADPQLVAAALTELVDPTQGTLPVIDGGPVVKFSSASERHNFLAQWFEVVALERPVILWVEDAQWANDTLDVLACYLTRQSSREPSAAGRVLAIMTSQDEELDKDRATPAARKLDQGQVLSLTLEPLSGEDHLQFIHELLGLEPELEQRLAESTQGNPLFAMQIMSDWVERDLLEVGDQGFRLRSGSKITLPAGVLALWQERLAQLDSARVGEWRLPLEIAAAMGHRFSRDAWERACHALGAELEQTLLGEMFSRAMFERENSTKETIAWKHSALREVVQQQSKAANRWGTINLGLALLLDEIPHPAPKTLERRAYHLIEVGEHEEMRRALDALLAASAAYIEQSQYNAAREVHAKHSALCDALGLGPHALDRVKTYPERADLARYTGDLAESETLARIAWDATEHATTREARRLHADACRGLAMCTWLGGQLDRSEKYSRRAIALYEELGEDIGRLRTYHTRAWMMMRKNEVGKAISLFKAGDMLGEDIGERTHRAWCIHGLAEVCVRIGETARAVELGRRASTLFESSGCMAGKGFSHVCIADALRLGGDGDAAEQHYALADQILSTLGSALSHVNTFKRGVNFAMRRDWEKVQKQLESLPPAEKLVPRARADAGVLRACYTAYRGDARSFATELDRALDGLLEATDAHPDQIVLLRLAREQWQRHARPDLAGACAISLSRIATKLEQPDLDIDDPIDPARSLWSKVTPAG